MYQLVITQLVVKFTITMQSNIERIKRFVPLVIIVTMAQNILVLVEDMEIKKASCMNYVLDFVQLGPIALKGPTNPYLVLMILMHLRVGTDVPIVNQKRLMKDVNIIVVVAMK
jgi:hypothetical protein